MPKVSEDQRFTDHQDKSDPLFNVGSFLAKFKVTNNDLSLEQRALPENDQAWLSQDLQQLPKLWQNYEKTSGFQSAMNDYKSYLLVDA